MQKTLWTFSISSLQSVEYNFKKMPKDAGSHIIQLLFVLTTATWERGFQSKEQKYSFIFFDSLLSLT